jgi:hypothetical protein
MATLSVPGGSSSSASGPYPFRSLVDILADSNDFRQGWSLPSVLQLAGRTFGTIANAVTSVPTLFTNAVPARVTSASASSGELTITTDATGSTGYFSGTQTAAHYKTTVAKQTDRRAFVFKVSQGATVATTANQYWGCYIGRSAGYKDAGLQLSYTGSTYSLTYSSGGGTDNSILTGLSSAQASAGYWGMFLIDPFFGNIAVYYATGGSTPPTTLAGWTPVAIYTSTDLAGAASWVVACAIGQAGTGAVISAKFIVQPEVNFVHPPWLRGAQGYAATSNTVSIWHVSSASAVRPDLAYIRKWIADNANKYSGDAATITWGLVGSDSSLAACTAPATMEAGSSLDLRAPDDSILTDDASGDRLYWKLWVKATSSGSLEPGSVDLSDGFLPLAT